MIAPTMATHVVSADQDARGWILIKDGPVLVTSIWGFDVMSVGADPKEGHTQITIRDADGLWHKTSATVADVHRAISNARTLYYASKDIPRARLPKRVTA
jgi:hypothetical protein